MKNSTKNNTTLLAISFLLLLTVFLPAKAQAQMTDEEYAVINAVYQDDTYLYRITLFHKGWGRYFEYIENIINSPEIRSELSTEALKKKLHEKMGDIWDAIMMLKPLKIASRKLNPNIKLTRHFDTQEAVKKGVIRISKPIIDGEIAVLKQESLYEAPIFILEKKEGEWEIIYTFYDW